MWNTPKREYFITFSNGSITKQAKLSHRDNPRDRAFRTMRLPVTSPSVDLL
jgi:hypothetical protein